MPVEAKQVCFLPKLWKLPDGRPDLNSLMAFMTTILGHLSFTSPPTMDRGRLVEALEWNVPPVQIQELLDILVSIDCVRRLEGPVSKKTTPLQRKVTSFDDFFACGEQELEEDSSFLPHLSNLPSEDELEMDVEMMEVANVQREQTARQPQVEVTYEAAVDAFSRLTLFYETLQERMATFS